MMNAGAISRKEEIPRPDFIVRKKEIWKWI